MTVLFTSVVFRAPFILLDGNLVSSDFVSFQDIDGNVEKQDI